MFRIVLAAALGLTALTGCATTGGPAPSPPPPSMGGAAAAFDAGAFAWSQRPGANVIAGRLNYRQGPVRFTCSGSSVVLTPETAWSRERMAILYGSAERAALPSDEVRARTPRAPPGDATPFVKRTTCDEADQFAFGGLPDGAWYAITIARPAVGSGSSVALMRRVLTRGGRTVPFSF